MYLGPARILGIHQNRLYRILKQGEIEKIRNERKEREKQSLISVLTMYAVKRGGFKKSAKRLSIGETALWNRMKNHQISLVELRRQKEIQALELSGGNVLQAAGILGVDRTTLAYKYKKEIEDIRQRRRQEELERTFETLLRAKGDKSLAAKHLGIKERTLYQRLKRYSSLMIEEIVRFLNEWLSGLEKDISEIKTKSTEEMQRFFYHKYSEVLEVSKSVNNWMNGWVDKWTQVVQRQVLPRKIESYAQGLKSLESAFDICRDTRQQMQTGLDRIIEIINALRGSSKEEK